MNQFQVVSNNELIQILGGDAVPGNGNYGARGTGSGYASSGQLKVQVQVNVHIYYLPPLPPIVIPEVKVRTN